MGRRLNQYKGKLTAEQIAKGMNVARRNAQRLFEDAQLLIESSRYCSAATLAIISIEESGKDSILRRLAMAEGDIETSKIWREYRSHTKKTYL